MPFPPPISWDSRKQRMLEMERPLCLGEWPLPCSLWSVPKFYFWCPCFAVSAESTFQYSVSHLVSSHWGDAAYWEASFKYWDGRSFGTFYTQLTKLRLSSPIVFLFFLERCSPAQGYSDLQHCVFYIKLRFLCSLTWSLCSQTFIVKWFYSEEQYLVLLLRTMCICLLVCTQHWEFTLRILAWNHFSP